MKRRWRNIFFLSGVAAVVLMLLTFDTDWNRIKDVLSQAGIWFPVIVLLWGIIYLTNACSFSLIINDGTSRRVPFGKVFQLTVSGYALNYVTPLGLMGGEPYRILELSGHVGGRKATSAVILYSMMHICSHFCFWLSAVVLYVILHFCVGSPYLLNVWMCIMLGIMTAIFLLVLWLFSLGYRYGFVVKVFGILSHIPVVRKWTKGYLEKHGSELEEVDSRIAFLHTRRRWPFRWSLFLEYAARVISCIEYWLLIGLFMPGFTFWDSILVMAFSSLFSNLIFFSPMQMGGYEGGMALAAGGVQVPGAYGLYTALVARIRQIVWTVIGIILMKTGSKDD
ncbi:MAG: flippase-like domain-containing protein [Bacteroidaceae bacterium]|nr:flippase-like domain-containing protein [Bacteroidaceae bacterium]